MAEKNNINERQSSILLKTIEYYIQTAEPVGSNQLKTWGRLTVSPATIRNELKALEALGYLAHIHTSSGRVPTDKGYRYFVDSLKHTVLNQGLKTQLESGLVEFTETEDSQRLLSHLLSNLVDYVTVTIPPDFLQCKLEQLTFIKVASDKILAILSSQPTKQWELLLTCSMTVTQEDLNQLSAHLTQKWQNETLAQLVQKRIGAGQDTFSDLIYIFQLALRKNLNQNQTVLIQGVSKLFDQPEFTDIATTQKLVSMFEQQSSLADLIRHSSTSVLIGSEQPHIAMKECAMITVPYTSADQVQGVIGVIGPRRMPYQVLIPMLKHMSKLTQGI